MKRLGRPSQLEMLIALLTANKHQPVSLPQIRALGIAQHSARFNTLRKMGYVIENHMDRSPEGQVHSFYVLRALPGERKESAPEWRGSEPKIPEPLLFAVPARLEYPD